MYGLRPILSLFRIAIVLDLSFSVALNCTLCDDGSYPMDDQARVKYETATYSCEKLHFIAPSVKNETQCANLQDTGRIICMCGAEAPAPCTLCSDGTDMPDPEMEVIPGKTCAEMQIEADDDFDDDCKWWQAIVGPVCGCPSDGNAPDGICRICPGESLPNPDRMLDLRDGTSVSCMMLELEANVNGNAKCLDYQVKYSDHCGCFETTPAPSPQSKSLTTSGVTGRVVNWIAAFIYTAVPVAHFIIS